jgi:uncharacterized membrane protein (UPF0127 family)
MIDRRGGLARRLNDGLHPKRAKRQRGVASWVGVVGGVRANRNSQPRRFRGLPSARIDGRRVPIATTRRARLLGLALLNRRSAPDGLLIPGCRMVHTFGMRFGLDLVFLGESLLPVRRRRVAPRRIAFERRAQAVLELPVALDGGEG